MHCQQNAWCLQDSMHCFNIKLLLMWLSIHISYLSLNNIDFLTWVLHHTCNQKIKNQTASDKTNHFFFFRSESKCHPVCRRDSFQLMQTNKCYILLSLVSYISKMAVIPINMDSALWMKWTSIATTNRHIYTEYQLWHAWVNIPKCCCWKVNEDDSLEKGPYVSWGLSCFCCLVANEQNYLDVTWNFGLYLFL